MPTPIILDCDPGHDDALALLLAYASPTLDLRAITTVAGNQTLPKVTENARRVATLAGITDVPIAAGADRPLVRDLVVAQDVHGKTGLDGADLPEPEVPLSSTTATTLMAETIASADRPVTLVPTGPLTNVAHLLREHPESAVGIAQIVWMGGSTTRGNVTPYAEFNAFVDPEAAAEVLDSGIPVTMIGLNVTHQALATDEIIARIRRLGTDLATTIADLLGFFAATYERIWGLPAPPVHDAVAVARVIDPGLVGCVRAPISIETKGDLTSGATVVDLYERTGRPANAYAGVAVDVERFWDLMIDALATYP
ncbi:nucleoside hydrolase [Solicola gregarius]|uniref:Nucleoside hydrolase n=1 Tax=Solicola gregarius TaxID=2908642 RepID=A0AA46TLW0_9ACTN|nr:nucleoside hydrolase [Solicola gregarius]UYM06818.1 nucleoside hydrolase [Solicola gregarius]